MNNKKLINDRKEILRQHLLELHRTNWIRESDLIRDNAYYARDVFPQLIKKGYIAPYGILIHYFDIDAFIDGLYLCRTKEPIKAIGKKSAKSIGQKMSKSRIDMKEIIKQNSTPTYEDRAALDMEHCVDVKPKANPLEKFSVEDICLELSRRGYRGSMTYSL